MQDVMEEDCETAAVLAYISSYRKKIITQPSLLQFFSDIGLTLPTREMELRRGGDDLEGLRDVLNGTLWKRNENKLNYFEIKN